MRSGSITPALCTIPRSAVDAPRQVVAPRPHGVEVADVADLLDQVGRRQRPAHVGHDARDLVGVAPQHVHGGAERANDVTIASPMPEVAPVTTTRWPARHPGSGSVGHQRRRSAGPIRV